MESLAVISDIHSNHLALQAVLSDIENRGINQIVNLGDSLFGPVNPVATAELLMSNKKIVNIMGNCDQLLLLDSSPSATYNFVKPIMSLEMEQWIRSFENTYTYSNELLFCHGTPFANNQYLLEEVSEAGVRYKSVEQLSLELEDIPQTQILCGHSHVFKSIYLPCGKIIINAGSVGLPAYDDEWPHPHVMESLTPLAEYVIMNRMPGQLWQFELVSVPYDWNAASELALRHGREDYAYSIRTGRVNQMRGI